MEKQHHSYRTIHGDSESVVKEKGSKFLGYARPVSSREEAELFLIDIQSMHPKARHHCYAWRIGHPDPDERVNDDGEPSGTAGRPILGQIIKKELTNTMIIIVRYFGGTLLGTSGLIQAYKTSAKWALDNSRIIKIIKKEIWHIELDFSIVHLLEEWAPKSGFDILEREHKKNRMTYRLKIEKDKSESGRRELIAKLLDCYLDEVDMEKIEHENFQLKFCNDK